MWHSKISPQSVDSDEAQPTGGGRDSVEPCQESRTASGTSAGSCAQHEGETSNISLILQNMRKNRTQNRKLRRKVQKRKEDSDSDNPPQNQESDDPPHNQNDSPDILPRDHQRRRRRTSRPKYRSTGSHHGNDDSDVNGEGRRASISTINSSFEFFRITQSWQCCQLCIAS